MSNKVINSEALDDRIDSRVENQLKDFDGGGSSEGVSDETERMLWTIGSPRFDDEVIPADLSEGGYHLQEAYPRWGLQLRVREGVHLVQTTVDAQEFGRLVIAIHRLSDDSEDAGTQPPRPMYRRERDLDSGLQQVAIEAFLPPGNYFLERRSGPPLRRVSGFDEWDEIQQTDIPVEILRGWNLAYRPREEDNYPAYDSGGWAENYYYFGDLTFQVGSPLDEDED